MPQTNWNLTVYASSPTIQYLPYSDGDPAGGWTSWYTVSGYNNEKDGSGAASSPQGLPYRVTHNGDGSTSLAFNFTGNGLWLYGSANNSYRLSLDDDRNTEPFNFPFAFTDLLWLFPNLESGRHSMNITAFSNATHFLTFTRAIIQMAVGDDNGSSSSGSTSPPALQQITIPNSDNSWAYNGDWTKSQDVAGVGSPVASTKDTSANATLTFKGRGIELKGANDARGSQTYDIILDGNRMSYNASSWYLEDNTTMFLASSLDPSVTHNLTILNTAPSSDTNANLLFTRAILSGIDGDTVGGVSQAPTDGGGGSGSGSGDGGTSGGGNNQPSGGGGSGSGSGGDSSPSGSNGNSSNSSSTNVGAIAGGIVGGLVALVLIAVLLLCLRRKKRNRSSYWAQSTQFTDLPDTYNGVEKHRYRSGGNDSRQSVLFPTDSNAALTDQRHAYHTAAPARSGFRSSDATYGHNRYGDSMQMVPMEYNGSMDADVVTQRSYPQSPSSPLSSNAARFPTVPEPITYPSMVTSSAITNTRRDTFDSNFTNAPSSSPHGGIFISSEMDGAASARSPDADRRLATLNDETSSQSVAPSSTVLSPLSRNGNDNEKHRFFRNGNNSTSGVGRLRTLLSAATRGSVDSTGTNAARSTTARFDGRESHLPSPPTSEDGRQTLPRQLRQHTTGGADPWSSTHDQVNTILEMLVGRMDSGSRQTVESFPEAPPLYVERRESPPRQI